jgi:cobalt-zinc-cadmium efflux system protein
VSTHAGAHGHDHLQTRASDRRHDRQRLSLTLVLSALYLVAEVAGGLWTGSLALLADAGHMLADVGALALSLFAFWLAERPAVAARTFGWRRFEILAALANGLALALVAVFVLFEAVDRFDHPHVVNGLGAFAIASGGRRERSASCCCATAGALAHLRAPGCTVGDALGSPARWPRLAIWAFGWYAADPLASMAIALLVLRSTWLLLRETVDVLLEAAPAHLDVDELRAALLAEPGVASLHDLHVWTITSGMVSLSCHVHCTEGADGHAVLVRCQALLRQRFDVHHATLQIEPAGFEEAAPVC